MNLPTAKDINVYDSLDERWACEQFLGKTLEEAEMLFRENALAYQEDLMWMGPVAFRYYVFAYIRHLQSDASTGDSDAASCFAGLLQYRLEANPADLAPIRTELAEACNYMVANYGKFDAKPAIYGDLSDRFEKLAVALDRLSSAEPA